MKNLLSTILILSLLASATAGEFKLIKDISYADWTHQADDYAKERLKLDLYLPKDKTDFATIVWFHGGSIQSGNKTGKVTVPVAERFAKDGIAVVSVNYRLSPKVTFPTYIQDCAASVVWTLKQIESHRGNKGNVFVSGHSAGGYLAAMVGLDPRFLEVHGQKPSDIAGYIPVAGQMITHSTVRKEQGIPKFQTVIDKAAPAFHASKTTPPFLCLVGDKDLAARLEENELFVAFMKAQKNPHIELHLGIDRNHNTIAANLANQDDPGAARIFEFIEKHSMK